MKVKQRVLQELEGKKGEFVSGEQLAEQLGVSRAAVWKAIRALSSEGYALQAVSGRGYQLEESNDIVSREGMLPYLNEQWRNLPILVYAQLDSTNREAKSLAAQGAVHGTVVIAKTQTAGRGRLGRSFSSPIQGGLYMSVVLRPRLEAALATDVTTAAAVAVCRTVERVSEARPQIKWVNDVFLRNKKICGILTEAVTDVETGMIDSLIVGIGVNVSTPEEDFPEEVRQVAGSVFTPSEEPVSRNQIAAGILNELLSLCEGLGTHRHMEEYRKRCLTLGKKVSFQKDGRTWMGTAEGIQDNGALEVCLDGGERIVLQSGEVSVRPY